MKKFITLIIVVSMLMPLTACDSNNAKNPAAIEVNAEKQPVQAFGIVKALEVIELRAPFALKIIKIHAKEGQSISKGDVLADFDAHDAFLQLELLEQELSEMKAANTLRNKILNEKKELLNNNSDPELLKLEKSLEAARLKHLAAAEDLSDLETLKNLDTATEKDYRDAVTASELSRIAIEELQLSLDCLNKVKQKEIQSEELQIARELSEMKLLKSKIEQMAYKMKNDLFKENRILSPISRGIIEKAACRQDTEAAEKTLLFSIINTDTLIVEANVDEQFIGNVHLGARAYIIPESDRSIEYKGRVTFISSIAVLQNGETVIAVQITPDDKDILLLPGSNAEIDIVTE